MEAAWFVGGLACGIVLTNLFMLVLRIFSPWLRCFLSGAPISMMSLVGMYLRGSPVRLLIDAHIGLVQSGVQRNGQNFRMADIESKYLANPGKYFTSQELMNALREDLEPAR